MGAVVYQNGETQIAYQGGGVWKRNRNGGSTMISPPEFHYRAGTLTLPALRVNGNDASAGALNSIISPSDDPFNPVFPNGGTKQNPINQGKITITVESRFCEGWEQYFDDRTEGSIDRCSGGDVVSVTLTTLGPQGRFDMLDDDGTESHDVGGLDDGHNLNSFETTLRPADGGNSFASLDWSMYVETSDNSGLELNVRKQSGSSSCGDPVVLSIYYSEDGQRYHGWQNDDTIKIQCVDHDSDGTNEEQINVNFLDSAVSMEYTGLTASNTVNFNPGTLVSATFDQHPTRPAEDDGGTTYSSGATESLEIVVEHYFALLGPGFELQVEDGNNGNAVMEACPPDAPPGCQPSTYTIEYTSNRIVRYLHVTDNEISVKFS
jgi:hypothetical protein